MAGHGNQSHTLTNTHSRNQPLAVAFRSNTHSKDTGRKRGKEKQRKLSPISFPFSTFFFHFFSHSINHGLLPVTMTILNNWQIQQTWTLYNSISIFFRHLQHFHSFFNSPCTWQFLELYVYLLLFCLFVWSCKH